MFKFTTTTVNPWAAKAALLAEAGQLLTQGFAALDEAVRTSGVTPEVLEQGNLLHSIRVAVGRLEAGFSSKREEDLLEAMGCYRHYHG